MSGAEMTKLRKAAGISQRTLAPHLGVHRYTIQRWERMACIPEDIAARLPTLLANLVNMGWIEPVARVGAYRDPTPVPQAIPAWRLAELQGTDAPPPPDRYGPGEDPWRWWTVGNMGLVG